MTKTHLKYLILGVLFWGVIIGFIVNTIFYDESSSIWFLLFWYVFGTVFVTLIAQYYIGGFPTKSPKKWFFIPLLSWVFCIVMLFIEGGFFYSGFDIFLPK